MTDKEKLLTLFRKARDNGWIDLKNLTENLHSIIEDVFIFVDDVDFVGTLHSINHIVISYEYEEICFIKALVDISEKTHKGVLHQQEDLVRFEDLELWENVIQSWSLKRKYCRFKQDYKLEGRPNSERLQWLFDTFSHLLT